MAGGKKKTAKPKVDVDDSIPRSTLVFAVHSAEQFIVDPPSPSDVSDVKEEVEVKQGKDKKGKETKGKKKDSEPEEPKPKVRECRFQVLFPWVDADLSEVQDDQLQEFTIVTDGRAHFEHSVELPVTEDLAMKMGRTPALIRIAHRMVDLPDPEEEEDVGAAAGTKGSKSKPKAKPKAKASKGGKGKEEENPWIELCTDWSVAKSFGAGPGGDSHTADTMCSPLRFYMSSLLLGDSYSLFKPVTLSQGTSHLTPAEKNALAVSSKFSVSVTVEAPAPSEDKTAEESPVKKPRFLPADLSERLKPVKITIVGAKELPPDPSTDEFGSLDQLFRPVFCRYRFFGARGTLRDPAVATGSVEVVESNARWHGERIVWNHSTVFFLGLIEPSELSAWCGEQELLVELHDRDSLQAAEQLEEEQERKATEEEKAKVEADTKSKHAKKTGGKAGTSGKRADKKKDEPSVSEEDKRETLSGQGPVRSQLMQQLTAQAEPFGVARFKLTDLFRGSTRFTMEAPVHPHFPPRDPPGASLRALKPGDGAVMPGASSAGSSVMSSRVSSAQVSRIMDADALDDVEDAEAAAKAAKAEARRRRAQLMIDPTVAVPTPRVNLYGPAGTYLSLRVQLAKIFPPRLDAAPLQRFHRLFAVLKYADSATLNAITDGMAEANAEALSMLKQPRRALIGVRLTAQQTAQNSSLDVLTGFQVVDAAHRIIVMEGLSSTAGGKAFQSLLTGLPRHGAHAGYPIVLFNSNATFSRRLYGSHGAVLKHIRLRETLDQIALAPRAYLKQDVPAPCFNAFTKLTTLCQQDQMRQVRGMELFPLATELKSLETVYGDFVSDADLAGPIENADSLAEARQRVLAGGGTAVRASATTLWTKTIGDGGAPQQEEEELLSTDRETKPRVDNHNPDYDAIRKEWAAQPKRDHHKEYLETIAASNHGRVEAANAEREALVASLGIDPDHMHIYSGQKQGVHELQKAKLQAEMSKDPNTVYTYSEEYMSATASYVDEEEVLRQQELQSRARFVTPNGFQLPPHRTAEECRVPSNTVGEARAAELRLPWIENEMQPKAVARSGGLAPGQKDFDNVASHTCDEFGYPGNPEWGKSVHLPAVGVEEEREAAKKAERDGWKEKLVVDNPHFKVLGGGSACAGVGSMVDGAPVKAVKQRVQDSERYASVLRDPPKKKGLVFPKKLKVEQPPPSAFTQDKYAPPMRSVSMRPDATDNDDSRAPFTVHVGQGGQYLKKGVNTGLGAGKGPKPLSEAERTGPHWGTAQE